jgi:predicted acyl esterase
MVPNIASLDHAARRSQSRQRPGLNVLRALLVSLLGTGVAGCDHMTAEKPKTQPAAISGAAKSEIQYPGGGKWEPGPAKYGVTVIDDVAVTMDDGVVLRASVAYPTDPATGKRAAGLFPVVIEHTPYTTLGAPVVPNAYIVERGYIYAVVRARGTGASEGDVQFFSPREGRDGKVLVDWAAHKLEASDGRVALLGCSFPAGIGLVDAAHVGPGSPLKAVIAACNGLYPANREAWMVGGIPTTGFWVFTTYGPNLMGKSPAATKGFAQIHDAIASSKDPAYDRKFWQDRGTLDLAQKIVDNDIPVLLWSGWQDIVGTAALRTYSALQNAYAKRPVYAPMTAAQKTTPRYQIIMGGWHHAEGLDAGLYLQWLDTWVKGVDTGIQTTDTPMHLFEGGTDRWINLARFPGADEATLWHLDESGALSPSRPKQAGNDKLVWGDPDVSDGKLSYTTPPLAEGATLAGPISATLYASSSNTNMELIAKLYDIAPSGEATEITRGALMGSLRKLAPSKSWTDSHGTVTWPWPKMEADSYLKPGQAYRFDMALSPRVWGVGPGHRLRLELTTQSPAKLCPSEGLPSSNGADPCKLTKAQQATVPGGIYRILHDPDRPSTVNLPQLQWKVFPDVQSGLLPSGWNENKRRLRNSVPDDGGFVLPLDWGK